MNDKAILIISNAPSLDEAEKIAAALVNNKLAACAQVSGCPVNSVYRWQGNVEVAGEWRIEIKTRAELFDACRELIRGIHPYEVPEIVSVALDKADDRYLQWIFNETILPDRSGDKL